MATDVKAIVSANVLALLAHQGGRLSAGETGITRLVRLGIPNGTAQRVLGGSTSIGLDVLQQVADALKVPAWQLLIPELDPASPPGLTADPTAWPFPMVSRTAYAMLNHDQRVFVQSKLDTAIRDQLTPAGSSAISTSHRKERGAVTLHDSPKQFGT